MIIYKMYTTFLTIAFHERKINSLQTGKRATQCIGLKIKTMKCKGLNITCCLETQFIVKNNTFIS